MSELMLNREDKLEALEAEAQIRIRRSDEYENTLGNYKVEIRDLTDNELYEQIRVLS